MRGSRRVEALPEYLSARLMRLTAEARARGEDVIALGIGDPDTTPSDELREALFAAVRREDTHGYPTNHGLGLLREAVATYYLQRFGVTLDPEREVLPLLGAKEGLAHLSMAQLDEGDVALVGDPGYPVYRGGPALAGAEAVGLPLTLEHGFLPDLAGIPAAEVSRANLLICSYPNNPTGAVADSVFFDNLAAFGLDRGVPICHDNAYAELTYDGIVAPSFLAAPGALEAGIELYSLSKALSLPGWRLAFAVGNAEMLARLRLLKTHIDSGMWAALQRAAVTALALVPSFTAELRPLYERRRDLLCSALEGAGVPLVWPKGALYVWMPVPEGATSLGYAERLLAEQSVVVGPGVAYGPHGEGYVRLALTAPDERLEEAAARIIRTF